MDSNRYSGNGTRAAPQSGESAVEVLYNTAVQSFVRRDHLKTFATLSRLLSTLSSSTPRSLWYTTLRDDDQTREEVENSAWLIKTLKLYISAHASIYAEPPSDRSQLSPELQRLLPPTPPGELLQSVIETCVKSLSPKETSAGYITLPPAIISTLLLASLKIRSRQPALAVAHDLAEQWLSALPDEFILDITPAPGIRTENVSPERKKAVESAREGYLKVVELFTGEILAREEEWEMARGILEGDSIMSSRKKESLYRHLRAVQTQRENLTSPSSSGILPSPSSSTVLSPSESPTPKAGSSHGRARSGSSTSSSSELTARPTTGLPLTRAARPNRTTSTLSGSQVADDDDETIPQDLPRRIDVNPPSNSTSRSPGRLARNGSGGSSRGNGRPDRGQSTATGMINGLISSLPPSIQYHLHGLQAISMPKLLGIAIPIPIVATIVMLLALRRRYIRARNRAVAASVGAVTATAGDLVRERLARVRGRRGYIQWLTWFVKWWIDKFAGVWKLGTTITYV